MGKVIVEAEISLDGRMNGPGYWERVFKYHSEDIAKYLSDLLFSPDALLMGRATYESFAQVWPTREGRDADRINAMPKHVASRTLKGPLAWNATLIDGDVANSVAKLKESTGGSLVQYGVGELTHTMLSNGLVDELRLIVFPIIFRDGPSVFENLRVNELRLLDTHVFESGAVVLRYQPLPPNGTASA